MYKKSEDPLVATCLKSTRNAVDLHQGSRTSWRPGGCFTGRLAETLPVSRQESEHDETPLLESLPGRRYTIPCFPRGKILQFNKLAAHGMPPMNDVTRVLSAIEDGDPHAAERLLPLVYDELRKLAAQRLAQEKPGQTLEATALVHEAYIRLVDWRNVDWKNRCHFFGVAAQMMRRILVDHARGKNAAKRGDGAVKVTLDEGLVAANERDVNVLALDGALTKLGELDAQQSQIVELRFFAGLSIEETAEILKISPATVKRDWAMAKAWLYREMQA